MNGNTTLNTVQAAAPEKLLLVIGGEDNGGEFVNSTEQYDPSTNEWEGEAVASMPSARKYAGMAVLDGKLYAVGGESEDDATSNGGAVRLCHESVGGGGADGRGAV